MIIVRDIMNTDVITVTPDMDISRAAKILFDKRINGVPVVDDNGSLVGILCQSDIITQQKKLPIPTIFTFLDGFIRLTSLKQLEKQVLKITALKVSEAMTPKPITVQPDTEIETVAALMVDKHFHTLPVVEDSSLVGIIGKEDILRTLLSNTGNT
ncbi:MAG: CBS domain-containing protein [Candidatus Desulfaltia sp.]|nr:CBS domain-containing protein [Candidatus Desulfaltia sp.]